MSLFRWIIGMPMAALVTAGLFFLMAQLIRDKVVDVNQPVEAARLKITMDKPPPDGPKPRPTDDLIPKEIPPTELEFTKTNERPVGPTVKPTAQPTPDAPPGQKFVGPTIRVTPPYPENCRSRGVEGVVVVQFDVTPEGNVVNPRVIDTPNACFVRPLIKAVSGWKYSPAAGGGMRYGVVETFNFQLTE